MTTDVITASPSTTIAEALTLTRSHRIRHLPVVDGGVLVGLVSDRDLRLAMPPMWAEELTELQHMLHARTVGDVMARSIITTDPDAPIEDVARQMYQHRVGCVPVMDGGKLVGILTETDVLRSFVELFGIEAISSRLEVRLPNRPGELARVVRVIGIDHRINITGMVVPPITGTKDCLAIIHVQTLDPTPLIENLTELGYQVGWPALDLTETRVIPIERRRYWAEAL